MTIEELEEKLIIGAKIWDEKQKDFDSIYHLFGNDLEHFFDCEVLS